MDKLKETAARVLQALLDAGADDAAVTAASGETREFNVESGDFTLFRTMFDSSLQMTAICGGKRGSTSLNSFEESAIENAVKDCMEIAAAGSPDPAWGLNPEPARGTFREGAPEPDLDRFFTRCRELLDTIRKDYPAIVTEQLIFDHSATREVFLTSRGAEFSAEVGSYSIGLDFSAKDGDLGSSFFFTGFSTTDVDTPFIDQCTVRSDLEAAMNSVHTESVEGKFTGTVILQPNCLSDLLGTALSLFASDTSLISGTSLWKDSLGTKIADERITLSAAPLDSRILCGERWTGEGFLSDNYEIIRDGVLNAFMLSLYGSNRTGLPRAANTSGALIMKPGERPLAELIASVEDGLLIGRFSGGEPASNGDFSGVAKNSFRIRNGKITGAVSETMISGNLADLLKNPAGISREVVCDGGTVMPWAAFRGVVISGK